MIFGNICPQKNLEMHLAQNRRWHSGSASFAFPGLYTSARRQEFTSPKRKNADYPQSRIKVFHVQMFCKKTPSTHSFLNTQNSSNLKISQKMPANNFIEVINGVISFIYKDAIGARPLGTRMSIFSHCCPCDLNAYHLFGC